MRLCLCLGLLLFCQPDYAQSWRLIFVKFLKHEGLVTRKCNPKFLLHAVQRWSDWQWLSLSTGHFGYSCSREFCHFHSQDFMHENVQDSQAFGNRFSTWDKILWIGALFLIVSQALVCWPGSIYVGTIVHGTDGCLWCHRNQSWKTHSSGWSFAKHCLCRQSLVNQLDPGLWEMGLYAWTGTCCFFYHAFICCFACGRD